MKGVKGFQKGHPLYPGGKLFGSGQKIKRKKGVENKLWKGGPKESAKRKYQKNKDYYRLQVIKRRARKKGVGGSFTQGEWEDLKKKYGNACPSCKQQVKLEIDHIIPISKGGSNNIENIQPLCRKCNAKKHTKIIIYEY